MEFSLGEEGVVGQEGRVGPGKGVGQEKPENDTGQDREETHESEKPEPAGFATNTSHVQDAVSEKLGRCLTQLVAKVEDYDSLCCLVSGI